MWLLHLLVSNLLKQKQKYNRFRSLASCLPVRDMVLNTAFSEAIETVPLFYLFIFFFNLFIPFHKLKSDATHSGELSFISGDESEKYNMNI